MKLLREWPKIMSKLPYATSTWFPDAPRLFWVWPIRIWDCADPTTANMPTTKPTAPTSTSLTVASATPASITPTDFFISDEVWVWKKIALSNITVGVTRILLIW